MMYGMITWNTEVNAPGCPGEILGPNGESLLIQTDWDYPATATTFGWDMRDVQKCKPRKDFVWGCDCGVWVCPECGEPLYPMELDEGNCPDCGVKCERLKVCNHSHTDGTVDCPDCGVTAGQFIDAARGWLDNNNGATAKDPGYFGDE